MHESFQCEGSAISCPGRQLCLALSALHAAALTLRLGGGEVGGTDTRLEEAQRAAKPQGIGDSETRSHPSEWGRGESLLHCHKEWGLVAAVTAVWAGGSVDSCWEHQV